MANWIKDGYQQHEELEKRVNWDEHLGHFKRFSGDCERPQCRNGSWRQQAQPIIIEGSFWWESDITDAITVGDGQRGTVRIVGNGRAASLHLVIGNVHDRGTEELDNAGQRLYKTRRGDSPRRPVRAVASFIVCFSIVKLTADVESQLTKVVKVVAFVVAHWQHVLSCNYNWKKYYWGTCHYGIFKLLT